MNPRMFKMLERLLIALILLGIFGMFQPWDIIFYTRGFAVLALSTLAYIVLIHLPVKEANEEL